MLETCNLQESKHVTMANFSNFNNFDSLFKKKQPNFNFRVIGDTPIPIRMLGPIPF